MSLRHFMILCSILIWSCSNDGKEDQIKPRLSDITESVYASASLVPDDSYFVKSNKTGIINKIYVEDGDLVKKGQTLFEISASADVQNRSKNANINLNEAQANYSGPNNALISMKLELASLQEQYQLDSIYYERKNRLWDQNIGSKNELDRAMLALQTSQNKLKSLQSQYLQTSRSLKSQYEMAKNQANAELSQLSDFKIASEIDGKVFDVYKQVGEYISPQENFAEIGSPTDYIIEMDVDEVDIAKINVGDTAIISLEAYADRVYLSTITYISDKKDQRTQTFKIESEFVEAPPKLFHGLSGEGNIVIEKRKNVLIIPSDYVVSGNKVLTEKGEVAVKLGIKSLDYVEVVSGIDTSTLITKPN